MCHRFDNEYNNNADQINRQNRARYQKMNIVSLDIDAETAIIESSDGNSYYTVTRHTCTCKDFQKRRQPCKHIYKLCDVLDDSQSQYAASGKSRIVALLLCVFFGYFGAHYFYAGRWGMGFLYLFTAGLFCFGWFYDIYKICTGKFCDKWGVIL